MAFAANDPEWSHVYAPGNPSAKTTGLRITFCFQIKLSKLINYLFVLFRFTELNKTINILVQKQR